jgi:hypothetical protein
MLVGFQNSQVPQPVIQIHLTIPDEFPRRTGEVVLMPSTQEYEVPVRYPDLATEGRNRIPYRPALSSHVFINFHGFR